MGGIIGGIGSAIGASQQASAAKESAAIQAAAMDRAGERALTGYNYLTSGAGAQPMNSYIQSGQAALNNQGTTQNLMMDLLGITDYGNSTGRPRGQYATQQMPTGTQQPGAAPQYGAGVAAPQPAAGATLPYGPVLNAFGNFVK